jgi:hypothetical protein
MRMAEIGVPEPLSTAYWSVLKKTAPNPLSPHTRRRWRKTPQCAGWSPVGLSPSAELPTLSLIPAPGHPQTMLVSYAAVLSGQAGWVPILLRRAGPEGLRNLGRFDGS